MLEMPRCKSEAYMKDIMTRYRNKLVYDASTGELKDDRKHMSMLRRFLVSLDDVKVVEEQRSLH